jgi:hypothetical protein
MIAKYNNEYYLYICNRRTKEIITRQKIKTDNTFVSDDCVFYKQINSDDIEDLFDVKFFVSCDSGIANTPTEWEIGPDEIKGDQILLRFADGILPGWKVEEKNVCTKCIGVEDVLSAKEVRSYKRKDYVTLLSENIKERTVESEDLILQAASFAKNSL